MQSKKCVGSDQEGSERGRAGAPGRLAKLTAQRRLGAAVHFACTDTLEPAWPKVLAVDTVTDRKSVV